MAERESSLAVLVNFENMARPGAKGRADFDIHLVLNRLAEKGRVIVKRAYADWSRYRDARHELMNAGLGLIEMPSAREGAKNRADIQMAVDAMELAYSREHVNAFVIVSGDSDFTPLVGKLRELDKRVIGVGNRESASELLIANCDEFIFYDRLAAEAAGGASARRPQGSGANLNPVQLLQETLTALQREGVEWPLASIVKDSMRRKYPAFDESEHGYSTFSKFLEEAGGTGMVRLETDPRSGTYRVELAEGRTAGPADAGAAPSERPERGGDEGDGRRRRRRGRPPVGDDRHAGGPGRGARARRRGVRGGRHPDARPGPGHPAPAGRADLVRGHDHARPRGQRGAARPGRDQRRRSRRAAGAQRAAPPASRCGRRPRADDRGPRADPARRGVLRGSSERSRRPWPRPRRPPRRAARARAAPPPPHLRRRRRARRARAGRRGGGARRRGGAGRRGARAGPRPPPGAPPRRGRRRREPVAEAEAPAEPVAEEAPAEEEAPKPKRRTRKKAEPAAEEVPSPRPWPRGRGGAEAAPPHPRGRRGGGGPPSRRGPAEEEAPKPKRTRTRKKAEPAAEEAPAAEAAETSEEEAPTPKRRVRRKAPATAEAAAE